jgi:hypothetical protein
VTTVNKSLVNKKRDDGGRGCQELSKIAWRHLWTTPLRSQSNYVGLSQSIDKMIGATQFKLLLYKRNACFYDQF